MNPIPAMITNRTMNSLSPTRTMLTRIDSLMPIVMSTPRSTTSPMANRSTLPPELIAAGTVIPMFSRNTLRYADQPCATTLAPRNISRMRSHPMIHAKISPRLA